MKIAKCIKERCSEDRLIRLKEYAIIEENATMILIEYAPEKKDWFAKLRFIIRENKD